jgi:metal-responsive CopG/Arc/MetJ family transcriptional regulator
MPGLHPTRLKISVSLPRDVVASIDRAARMEARSRSRVLEGRLRAIARERAVRELEAATIAYYESLTPDDRQEEARIAAAAAAASRRLAIDDIRGSGSPRRRRRR